MATRALREYHGKRLLSRWVNEVSKGEHTVDDRIVLIHQKDTEIDFNQIELEHPWLLTEKLVVKPDQRIKRRGKGGLLLLNANWNEAKDWITQRINQDVQIESVRGPLTHFLVEPFVPHDEANEYYVCMRSLRNGEEILFHHEGGINIGDVDDKALRMLVPVDGDVSLEELKANLLTGVPSEHHNSVARFLKALFSVFVDLHFAYLEINPLVVLPGGRCVPLDLAATIDETAGFLVKDKWGDIEFPPPFGRPLTLAESYIHDLDSKTGASLKLTVLNPQGRVWTMVAGGGASVVYADTISDLGYGSELANYGEYSGAPTEATTYEYARTILGCMTASPPPPGTGKVLIIGGGIANFTDVAKTFKGIIHALTEYADALRASRVRVWVRRAGPNYQEGLRMMRELGNTIRVPIAVYGPETHITAIVPLAMRYVADCNVDESALLLDGYDSEGNLLETQPKRGRKASLDRQPSSGRLSPTGEDAPTPGIDAPIVGGIDEAKASDIGFVLGEDASASYNIMTADTQSVVYGLQQQAVQGMLDFDYLCKRARPSVSVIVFPFSGNHYMKFYWGTEEIMLPVIQNLGEALSKRPEVSLMVNFASFRSVYSSTMDALRHPQLKSITIIAEGVPERQTRSLIREAERRGVTIIGPATVGGIKPGSFRIGNTGGMLDNVLMSKLYRPGSVAYVSKSGGMSNELNNIVCRNSDGVYEGIAIGGDRYPGTRFVDHLLRYQDNPNVKILVLLGEVGGVDEYDVCNALRSGRITKPLVAWCIGTCAKMFPFEVQFGHAGALARGNLETSDAKNRALAAAGAIVPDSFDTFDRAIRDTFNRLVEDGTIVPRAEPPVPRVPMDYSWAKNLGLVRKPTSFVSSICDDRGAEPLYAGMPINKVFSEDLGVGGVLGLLWFRRRLPIYFSQFIEMVLVVTADHGPAVSGAHNTIVCARAGKDLVSSLCSGLLTIGPRFGGALDDSAKDFTNAFDSGSSPAQFVAAMRKADKLIMGIGHRIRSVENPDQRVCIVKEFAKKHFPTTPLLDYALEVEKITTAKRSNLILNVDGAIATAFVDLLRGCGAFTLEEADEAIANGCLNGLFVLGRSIGFIGHYLDQKRLKQGLYRHPWDDISYINDNEGF